MNTTAPDSTPMPIGVISKQSAHSVKATADRLQQLLQEKGITLYARIDQQAEAQKTGQVLLPTELLIFGNPKAGVPIMSAFPLAGLDLPLKILCWQDDNSKVWLSYNEPAYIQQRFSLPDTLAKNINVAPLVEMAGS